MAVISRKIGASLWLGSNSIDLSLVGESIDPDRETEQAISDYRSTRRGCHTAKDGGLRAQLSDRSLQQRQITLQHLFRSLAVVWRARRRCNDAASHRSVSSSAR